MQFEEFKTFLNAARQFQNVHLTLFCQDMKHKKEATIYDIASKLSISTATVSRALQNHPSVSKKTKDSILKTAKELGYRYNTFAANLRTQRTNTIGFLVHELNSTFITSVLAGVEKVTTEAGFDLLIAHSSESYKKEVANANNLFHKRVDGLIASLAFETKDLEHFQPFIEKNVPIIFFDRVEESNEIPAVIIDNYKAGYQATKHLIEQGCKRIVLVTASLNRNVYLQRQQGYKDALLEHGLKYKEDLVIVNDLSEKAGAAAAQQILKMRQRPDGIFITNDFVAAVCMQVLKDNGIRIPEDMAIVGFNNDAISKLVEPHLTTINYPGKDMGEIAARALVEHLNGLKDLKTANRIIIRSDLIVRESSLKKSGKHSR